MLSVVTAVPVVAERGKFVTFSNVGRHPGLRCQGSPPPQSLVRHLLFSDLKVTAHIADGGHGRKKADCWGGIIIDHSN